LPGVARIKLLHRVGVEQKKGYDELSTTASLYLDDTIIDDTTLRRIKLVHKAFAEIFPKIFCAEADARYSPGKSV
jgi:hypothetical protein